MAIPTLDELGVIKPSKPDSKFIPTLDDLASIQPVKQTGTGNFATDIPKMLLRGVAQIPEAIIASPIQAGASYLGKGIDTATGYPEDRIGPATANINYGLGKARDWTTRALQKKAEQVLP